MELLRIKVTLVGNSLPIWRRLEVPIDTSLDEFHGLIQLSMGWDNEHLFGFYLRPAGSKSKQFRNWPELDPDSEDPLETILAKRSDELIYEYDYGDSWIHRIKLEKRVLGPDGTAIPTCIAGERACPPEVRGNRVSGTPDPTK